MDELKKEYESICDMLQAQITQKTQAKIAEATAYRDGYYQACEDYFKALGCIQKN